MKPLRISCAIIVLSIVPICTDLHADQPDIPLPAAVVKILRSNPDVAVFAIDPTNAPKTKPNESDEQYLKDWNAFNETQRKTSKQIADPLKEKLINILLDPKNYISGDAPFDGEPTLGIDIKGEGDSATFICDPHTIATFHNGHRSKSLLSFTYALEFWFDEFNNEPRTGKIWSIGTDGKMRASHVELAPEPDEKTTVDYGMVENLHDLLSKWFGRKYITQPTGTIRLLFDLHIGDEKLNFLHLEDDGAYFSSDTEPVETRNILARYVILPIKPSLDAILNAKTVGEVLNAVTGGKIKDVWMVFASPIVKANIMGFTSIGQEVSIKVAYPSETNLTVLKVDFLVPPGKEPPDHRRVVEIRMELNSRTWNEGQPTEVVPKDANIWNDDYNKVFQHLKLK